MDAQNNYDEELLELIRVQKRRLRKLRKAVERGEHREGHPRRTRFLNRWMRLVEQSQSGWEMIYRFPPPPS